MQSCEELEFRGRGFERPQPHHRKRADLLEAFRSGWAFGVPLCNELRSMRLETKRWER